GTTGVQDLHAALPAAAGGGVPATEILLCVLPRWGATVGGASVHPGHTPARARSTRCSPTSQPATLLRRDPASTPHFHSWVVSRRDMSNSGIPAAAVASPNATRMTALS